MKFLGFIRNGHVVLAAAADGKEFSRGLLNLLKFLVKVVLIIMKATFARMWLFNWEMSNCSNEIDNFLGVYRRSGQT